MPADRTRPVTHSGEQRSPGASSSHANGTGFPRPGGAHRAVIALGPEVAGRHLREKRLRQPSARQRHQRAVRDGCPGRGGEGDGGQRPVSGAERVLPAPELYWGRTGPVLPLPQRPAGWGASSDLGAAGCCLWHVRSPACWDPAGLAGMALPARERGEPEAGCVGAWLERCFPRTHPCAVPVLLPCGPQWVTGAERGEMGMKVVSG